MYGNPRQSWILDSRPWISDSRYWIRTEYFVNGTYRFRIRIVSRIPNSLSSIPYSKAQDSEFRSKNFSSTITRIPDSKIFQDSAFRSKNLLDSGFYKQKFPGFRIPSAWATFNSQIRNLYIYLYMFSTMTSMILNVP